MRRFRSVLLFSLLASVGLGGAVFAQSTEEIEVIQETITQKRKDLERLGTQIDALENQVDVLNRKARSLKTDTDILANRIAKTQLTVEKTQLESEAAFDEIRVVDGEMVQLEAEREKQRAAIRTSLREIQRADERNQLAVLFTQKSFSEFYENLRAFEEINTRLKSAVEETKTLQAALQSARGQKENKLEDLRVLEEELEAQKRRLAEEESAKGVLLARTRASEAEFQELVRALEEEQAFIQSQVAALQRDMESRLRDDDEEGLGASNLSWPISRSIARLTATFNDPTYPFRRLWEHSGVDLAAPHGTPVYAPAPGYVAWTRTGKLYGNYVMIVHADGIATLYAHLSAFTVVPDQFISRGEQVGRVGSTGFSTGPHLHFEVRKDGIPTNPLNYLITE